MRSMLLVLGGGAASIGDFVRPRQRLMQLRLASNHAVKGGLELLVSLPLLPVRALSTRAAHW